jgi:putative transposase
MLVIEYKIRATKTQYKAIDEAIRTTQFIRNKSIRFWLDNKGVNGTDLNKNCTKLAKEFKFVGDLNSMARQAAAERAWLSISRFYSNCKKKIKGKKGFPKFKKNVRSVEYKTCGWKLDKTKKILTFSDKKRIGTIKLVGSRDINFYSEDEIKRIRLIKRADGYYAQFCIAIDPRVTLKTELEATGKAVGIDLGLVDFITDNEGLKVPTPKFYRQGEKQLNRANRKKSKRFKQGAKPQSNKYKKASRRYSLKHLRVSRQRKEWLKSLALRLVKSRDIIVYEDLNVKGLVKNPKLAKSISDAGWSIFRQWLDYFAYKYGKVSLAVPPHYTSQECSNCGMVVKKALSERTHICSNCKCVLDRDENAAINIFKKGIYQLSTTLGHRGCEAPGDETSTLIGEILLRQVLSMNGESHATPLIG